MSDLLPAGALLHERYQVIGLIGSGGMGAVYLTDDNRLQGRRCAVKETRLLPHFGPDAVEAMRSQFHQEANILAQLDHPNLPKVSDYFSQDNRDYLVMDYVDGPDLAHILAAARAEHRFLEEDTVWGWVEALCDALTYMHNRPQPIVHRDIKPANIKLTSEGRVKLVDFGLVKPLDASDPRTITGLHGVGSLPYTPLEQYVEEMGHTDPRSDLYGLGATMYHLLTGEVPPSAQDRFLNPSTLVPPCQINPKVSPHTESAILSAMALHPHDRPESVAQWFDVFRMQFVPSTPSNPAYARHTEHLEKPDNMAGWDSVWKQNQSLIVTAALLLIAALALTFLGPPL
jgi:eukaryotic-like serine/threonine-protein kinase